MIRKTLSIVIASCLSGTLYAKAIDGFFCPQSNTNVRNGMSIDDVLQACGKPQAQSDPDQQITKNVPVTRINYNNLNRGPLYFWKLDNVYSLFSQPSGGQTNRLAVLVVDGKIKSLILNGAEVKTTDACSQIGGTSYGTGASSPSPDATLSVGDSASNVLNYCGSADLEEQSYMPVPVPKNEQPQQWTYKVDQYHPAYTLTFVKGILQSIETDSQ
jgi:hypothetical protein